MTHLECQGRRPIGSFTRYIAWGTLLCCAVAAWGYAQEGTHGQEGTRATLGLPVPSEEAVSSRRPPRALQADWAVQQNALAQTPSPTTSSPMTGTGEQIASPKPTTIPPPAPGEARLLVPLPYVQPSAPLGRTSRTPLPQVVYGDQPLGGPRLWGDTAREPASAGPGTLNFDLVGSAGAPQTAVEDLPRPPKSAVDSPEAASMTAVPLFLWDEAQIEPDQLPAPREELPAPREELPAAQDQTGAPAGMADAAQDETTPEFVPTPAPAQDGPASGLESPAKPTKEKYAGPTFVPPPQDVQCFDNIAQAVPYHPGAFAPPPIKPTPHDPQAEADVYRGKFAVPVQRPLVELGRPLYTSGIYPPARTWLGEYNPVMPHFMVYGDFRTGVGVNRNANGDADSWAFRTNLDMDLEITATERVHAFMGPLDRTGDFTRLDFSHGVDFVNRTDMRFDALFFEGDVGSIWGGFNDQNSPFDLPFTFGFLPVFYQNGIWANDTVIGAAFALPARHSRALRWSNFDATFFWASDQVTSDAFLGDNNAAEFFGTAWFIEAYDGYIEADYAFVHDDVGGHRSYHNFSIGFTRRYFHRISNSIRLITNFNQSLPRGQRTADGHLLLIENSLITSAPNTFVPYFNVFYGQGRTQSLARAGVVGGVLNNTGINFETDGLTGYPTLDATAVNTVGAALGVNLLGCNFNQQLVLEVAALAANGSRQFRNAPGDQYAVGMRYQRPLNHAWIFRTDHMFGFLRGAEDIRGSRVEFRWKF